MLRRSVNSEAFRSAGKLKFGRNVGLRLVYLFKKIGRVGDPGKAPAVALQGRRDNCTRLGPHLRRQECRHLDFYEMS